MKANSLKHYRWLSAVLMLVFSLAIHGDQEVSAQQPLLNALNNLKQGSMHGTRTGDYATFRDQTCAQSRHLAGIAGWPAVYAQVRCQTGHRYR